VEDETLREQRGVVVENRPVQKEKALAVDEDLRAVALDHLVAEPRFLFPGKGVAESRAPAALDAHSQTAFVDALLGHQRLDLLGGAFCDLDHDEFPTSNSPLPNSRIRRSWELARRQT